MKIEVSEKYLNTIYQATQELRVHGCTYRDIDMLNRIRNVTKYYLDKGKEE